MLSFSQEIIHREETKEGERNLPLFAWLRPHSKAQLSKEERA